MLTPVNGCVSFRITQVGVTCNPAHMLKCRNHCGLCLFHSTSSVVFFFTESAMSCVKELEEHREALQSDRERGFGFRLGLQKVQHLCVW